MNQQEALQTLITAVQVATKRGAFELSETEGILSAVKTFTLPAKKNKTMENENEVVAETTPEEVVTSEEVTTVEEEVAE